MRPYYDDGACVIYQGDCREVFDAFPRMRADLIFTSPPYNLGGSPWPHLGHWKPGDSPGGKSKWKNGSDGSGGVSYADARDDLPWAEYVATQRAILSLCWMHLSDSGAIFYNHKPRVIGGRCWLPLEMNPDLPLRQIVVWARAGGMNFNPTAYVSTYEWLMVFAREAWRLRDKSASGAGDVWRVPQESSSEHPAPFPIGLPARAIETTGPGVVLDPFMGSGTTLRAAKNAGRPAIGIELSERYCEIAAKRLAQEVLDFGRVPVPEPSEGETP